MKKKEMIEVSVTYCDHCGKKINDYSFTTVELEDGSEKHFHSIYTGKTTCLEQYQKLERSKSCSTT